MGTPKQERMTRYQHALDMVVYAPKEELEKGKNNDDRPSSNPFGRSCHNQYYGEQAQAEAYDRGQRDARIAHEMAILMDHPHPNPHKNQRTRSADAPSSHSTKPFQ